MGQKPRIPLQAGSRLDWAYTHPLLTLRQSVQASTSGQSKCSGTDRAVQRVIVKE